MRRTDYRRRMMRVNNQLEEQIQKAAQSELNWLFRQYQYKVRRINQFRPKINTARPRLTKSYVANADLWDEFRKRMRTSIMRTIKDMLPILLALPTDQFKEYAVNFNSDDLAAQILPELGERITQVETSIKRSVGRKVLAWYNSPGVTMQSLINQIKEDNFTPARAQLIARTEVTYLNSRVSDLIAEQIGSTEWVFDSRNDSKVCIKPLVGPDGKMYNGCRALHGKTFKQGMKKPPIHPGDRCSAIDLPPKPKTVLEPKPIMEFGKFDPSEARDKNGEWTAGAGGSKDSIKVVTNKTKVLSAEEKFAAVSLNIPAQYSGKQSRKGYENQSVDNPLPRSKNISYDQVDSLIKDYGKNAEKQEVNISDLTSPQDYVRPTAVKDLFDKIKDGSIYKVDPIIATVDGEKVILNGSHTILAAKLAGEKTWPVRNLGEIKLNGGNLPKEKQSEYLGDKDSNKNTSKVYERQPKTASEISGKVPEKFDKDHPTKYNVLKKPIKVVRVKHA